MNSERVYGILLKFYPVSYRREYGEPMAQCFRDQLREADSAGKRAGFWRRTLADWARTVPARHWEQLAQSASGGTFSDYNLAAKRAIFFARFEAASFRSPQLRLEHLLLGVLREDEREHQDLGATILGREGVQQMIRTIELSEVNARCHPARKHLLIPLSRDCQEVFERARTRARDAGDEVAPRLLLSEILHQSFSAASHLLRELGRDLSSLE